LPTAISTPRLLQEGSRSEPFDLQLQRGGKSRQLKGAKGFLQRQATLAQEPFRPSLSAKCFLVFGQLMQIRFMGHPFFAGTHSQISKLFRHAAEFETIQDGLEVLVTIENVRHMPSLQME
jgi:hypothetical protein